jgi:hypothetical protein
MSTPIIPRKTGCLHRLESLGAESPDDEREPELDPERER